MLREVSVEWRVGGGRQRFPAVQFPTPSSFLRLTTMSPHQLTCPLLSHVAVIGNSWTLGREAACFMTGARPGLRVLSHSALLRLTGKGLILKYTEL